MFRVYRKMKHGKLMYGSKDVILKMVIYVVQWRHSMFLERTHLPEDDIRHWSKFPSFAPLLVREPWSESPFNGSDEEGSSFSLQSQVEADGGKSLDLSNCTYIFMRWKEQYFVNVGIDCGLTIVGFYYVCFSCSDGSINGFYYDPNSSPFQKLELKCSNEKHLGFTFSSYQLQ
ncbi:uncharacterized protein [Elaeis guineensis]|uniref:Glucose-induced degradation protein 4 homolog isoform X2 n=1 Tax=Elaeis guineensis var. tenera TaxID=51953 RepID=A0A6J0PIN7_ELAGV|nr:glucose-induced degradation protein 4 homolog isoform X2 [Elaeis guineensis]